MRDKQKDKESIAPGDELFWTPDDSSSARVVSALAYWQRSAKYFVSLMLCVAGLGYLALLAGIWQDTQFKMINIIEGYGSMGAIELVQHSFRYLFWFFGIFTVSISLFLMSSRPEKIKRLVALVVPVLIATDVGSAWLTRFHAVFGYTMAISGFILAAIFLSLFISIQMDLWGPKKPVR